MQVAVYFPQTVLCGPVKTIYARPMISRLFVAFWILVVAVAGWGVAAQPVSIEKTGVIVCPAVVGDVAPPDFTGPDCKTMNASDVDPQNELIWVKGKIILEQTTGPAGEPLALYVRGKMSSAFYLNGAYIGANGTPGPDAASETPGRMDAVLYPPQKLFRTGVNEVIFKASAHRGFVTLGNPLHMITINISGDITDSILRHYWPSLLTLGLFLVGALYFAIIGISNDVRKRSLTISVICAFAAAQLLAEVYRGLVSYSYPVHDLRLVLITVFSGGFGLSVAFHVFSTFEFKQTGVMLALLAALSLIGVIVMPGFDLKAAAAMMTPLAAALIATGVWSFRQRPRAVSYVLSLFVFLAAIFAFPRLFLDVVFFYLVALFLLFLFVEQGFALVHEAATRRREQARADRLELALEQAKERAKTSIISIKSAGKMERVSTNQIVHCRGASGYAEIFLQGGREILHSATLAQMEESLPATFLRVHRSHLVNTAFVQSLNRDPAGTGTLILSDGSKIPVSRRVMPKVRQVLG